MESGKNPVARPGALILLASILLLSATAVAGKPEPASKPPAGYPAGVPFIAGGVHDTELSFPGTIVLKYEPSWEQISKQLMAELTAGKWKLESGNVPNMKGERFVGRKAGQVLAFTIKPNHGKPQTVVLITDTNHRKR